MAFGPVGQPFEDGLASEKWGDFEHEENSWFGGSGAQVDGCSRMSAALI